MTDVIVKCSDCDGTGERRRSGVCGRCGGRGYLRTTAQAARQCEETILDPAAISDYPLRPQPEPLPTLPQLIARVEGAGVVTVADFIALATHLHDLSGAFDCTAAAADEHKSSVQSAVQDIINALQRID